MLGSPESQYDTEVNTGSIKNILFLHALAWFLVLFDYGNVVASSWNMQLFPANQLCGYVDKHEPALFYSGCLHGHTMLLC